MQNAGGLLEHSACVEHLREMLSMWYEGDKLLLRPNERNVWCAALFTGIMLGG